MADFLLTGAVNSDKITADIVKAVNNAAKKVASIQVNLKVKNAEERIRILYQRLQSLGREVKVNLDIREAKAQLGTLMINPNIRIAEERIRIIYQRLASLGRPIKVNLDVSEAKKDIQALDLNPNVHTAEMKIKLLFQRLQSLARPVKINLDTIEAKGRLTALYNQLNLIRGVSRDIKNISRDISFAGAKQSAGTGLPQVKTSKTTSEPKAVQTQKFVDTLSTSKKAVDSFKDSADSLGASLGGPLARNLGTTNDLFGVLTSNILLSTIRLTAFSIAGSFLFGFGRSVQQSVVDIIEFDQALTNVNKVLNLSNAELSGLGDGFIQIAKKTSTSLKEVTEAATLFAQQGLSSSQILGALDAALTAVNASGISVADAIELITVSINSFDRGFDESNKIIDRLSTIADITAASVQDLSIVLQRSGAVADAAGISLERLASIGAVLREDTRLSASTIGSALKTILVNIQANEKILNQFGIATRTLAGEFLGIDNILRNLSASYATYNEEQKVSIAQLITGKRRVTELTSLLNSNEKALNIEAIAMASSGSAAQKQSKQLETLASVAERTSVQFSEFAQAIGSVGATDFLKSILRDTSSAIGLLTTLAKVVDGLKFVAPTASLLLFIKIMRPAIAAVQQGVGEINKNFGLFGETAKSSGDLAYEKFEKLSSVIKEVDTRTRALQKQLVVDVISKEKRAPEIGDTINGKQIGVPKLTKQDFSDSKTLIKAIEEVENASRRSTSVAQTTFDSARKQYESGFRDYSSALGRIDGDLAKNINKAAVYNADKIAQIQKDIEDAKRKILATAGDPVAQQESLKELKSKRDELRVQRGLALAAEQGARAQAKFDNPKKVAEVEKEYGKVLDARRITLELAQRELAVNEDSAEVQKKIAAEARIVASEMARQEAIQKKVNEAIRRATISSMVVGVASLGKSLVRANTLFGETLGVVQSLGIAVGTFSAATAVIAGPWGVILGLASGVLALTEGIRSTMNAAAAEDQKSSEQRFRILSNIRSIDKSIIDARHELLSLSLEENKILEAKEKIIIDLAGSLKETFTAFKENNPEVGFRVPSEEAILADLRNSVNDVNNTLTKDSSFFLNLKLNIEKETLNQSIKTAQGAINNLGFSSSTRLSQSASNAASTVVDVFTSKVGLGIAAFNPFLVPALAGGIFGAKALESLLGTKDLKVRVESALKSGKAEEGINNILTDLNKQVLQYEKDFAEGKGDKGFLSRQIEETKTSINEVSGILNAYKSNTLQSVEAVRQLADSQVEFAEGTSYADKNIVSFNNRISLLNKLQSKGTINQDTFNLGLKVFGLELEKLNSVAAVTNIELIKYINSLERLSVLSSEAQEKISFDKSLTIFKEFNRVTELGSKNLTSIGKEKFENFKKVEEISSALRENAAAFKISTNDFEGAIRSNLVAPLDKAGDKVLEVRNELIRLANAGDNQGFSDITKVDRGEGQQEISLIRERIASLEKLREQTIKLEDTPSNVQAKEEVGNIEKILKLEKDRLGFIEKRFSLLQQEKSIKFEAAKSNIQAEFNEAQKDFLIQVSVEKVNFDKQRFQKELSLAVTEASADLDKIQLSILSDDAIREFVTKIRGLSPVQEILRKGTFALEQVNDVFNVEQANSKKIYEQKVALSRDAATEELRVSKQNSDRELALQQKFLAEGDADAQKNIERITKTAANKKAEIEAKTNNDIAKLTLEENKRVIVERIAFERAKVTELSNTYKELTSKVAEFAGAVSETQNKIDSQLGSISNARKSFNDSLVGLSNTIADFNQQLFEAKFEANQASISIQDFINGVSALTQIDFIRNFTEANIAIVGGSEKRILELRKQASTEIISLLKDEVGRIRNIGETGFTSSIEDLIQRRLGDSLAQGIASGSVNPLSVSGIVDTNLASAVLDAAKRMAELGDGRALNAITGAGLGLAGEQNSLPELQKQLIEETRFNSSTTVRIAELNTEAITTAREQLLATQNQLAVENAQLSNLYGILGFQREQLAVTVDASQRMEARLKEAVDQLMLLRSARFNLSPVSEVESNTQQRNRVTDGRTSNFAPVARSQEPIKVEIKTDSQTFVSSTKDFEDGLKRGLSSMNFIGDPDKKIVKLLTKEIYGLIMPELQKKGILPPGSSNIIPPIGSPDSEGNIILR